MNFSVENGTVIFPEGITKIPMGAFSSCKELTTVIIPGSVTNIGDGAFRNCTNLVSAVIPEASPGSASPYLKIVPVLQTSRFPKGSGVLAVMPFGGAAV